MTNPRGQLLVAALGFARLSRPPYDHVLWALRTWLDSWAGVGRTAVGMARQGYDLQLTRHDDRGWRATFYTTGMEYSPTSATGTGGSRRLGARRSGRRGRRSSRTPDEEAATEPPRRDLRHRCAAAIGTSVSALTEKPSGWMLAVDAVLSAMEGLMIAAVVAVLFRFFECEPKEC